MSQALRHTINCSCNLGTHPHTPQAKYEAVRYWEVNVQRGRRMREARGETNIIAARHGACYVGGELVGVNQQ